MSVTETHLQIPAKDGFLLSATLFEPDPSTQRKGVIQLNSGTGIPRSLYANMVRFLADSGYTAVIYDYRGIGGSKPKSLKHFSAFIRDWGQLDMVGVLEWVNDHYPTERKILIGHSTGGQMVGLMENNDLLDRFILIASSTGYWKDMSKPYKWLMPPLWLLYIPLSIHLMGYANAKKFRHGENLPAGVALEWRKWCINPQYFEPEFGKSLAPLYFDQINIPLTSYQVSEDPIANATTANKLLTYYVNADVNVKKIEPSAFQVDKIGHTGFFSRKFRMSLWQDLLEEISQ